MMRIVIDTNVLVSDAPFLEVALTAEVPLVTGNATHFPEHYRNQTTIQTPAEFIANSRSDGPVR